MPTTYPMKINNVTILTPHSFQISRFNISKSARSAAGLMSIKFIAKKVKLFLKYNAITGRALKVILDQIDTTSMYLNITYYETTGTATTKVFYVGEIAQVLHRRGFISDDSIWKEIDFNFIER